jgi:hypothetical protein
MPAAMIPVDPIFKDQAVFLALLDHWDETDRL